MIRIVLFLSVLMAATLFASKWDEMNYGPYLTHSLEVRGAGIVNNKWGRNIVCQQMG